MDGEKGFLYEFGMCRMSLTIVGLWPSAKNSKYDEVISSLIFVTSISIIVAFINAVQTLKLVEVWGDLDQMTNIICTADLSIGAAIIKMLIFFHHKEGPLISFARVNWNSKKTPEESANMWLNARAARKLSFICVSLGIGTVNVHLLLRICQEFDIFPGKPDEPQAYFEAKFPYDIEPSPTYEITFAMQYIGAVLITIAYFGFHCLFIGLVLHLCGQFSNLRLRLERLEEAAKESGKFKAKLGQIVERHENLNGYVKVIEKVFNMMFLVEILSCSIQFCLQGYLLLTLSSTEETTIPVVHLLFLLVYLFHVGTYLFILCSVSEKLQDEGFSIFHAAYNCEWYNLAPEDTALLIIVMTRAKQPLQVTAGKFCVFSMGLYAQICKTSGGYLSMLLAIRDRIS